MFDKGGDTATAITITEGHYTRESMAKEIESAFAKYRVSLPTEINTPVEQMVIHNITGRRVRIEADLAEFLGGIS